MSLPSFKDSEYMLPLVIGSGTVVVLHLLTRPKRNLPPGPAGLPVVGNLFDLATEHEWLTFAKWADKWGPLTSASTLGTNIIVISTYSKAAAFLDVKYSTRPHVTMAVDLMGWGAASHFQPYGSDSFKAHRKTFRDDLLTNNGFKKWWPVEEDKAKRFVKTLYLQNPNPDGLAGRCYHAMASVLLRIIYGYDAKDQDDDFVKAGYAGMRTFNLGCAPAAKYAVNVIPALKYLPSWFPGAQFKRLAEGWKETFMTMVLTPWTYVKGEIAAGRAVESSIADTYSKGEVTAEEEGAMLAVAASYFGAGSQNLAITIEYFFLIMAQHPDIQKKAQAEIDAVIGRDRLPTLDDRDSLPYVNALIKELLRVHPPVPTGTRQFFLMLACIPHANTVDDIQDGYLIPKGSIIMFNIWKMLRDPALYPNPEVFDPERFVGSTPQQDPGAMAFGFGRRLCPGKLVAECSIFQTLSTCLATLNVAAPKGGPAPTFGDVGEPMNRLKPFSVDIQPRFEQAKMEQLLQL
ncbi:cytochrome P450 [Cylindrobasidium torrendii FP15055 ss-10]|uniref:Cytochrome P450 n=1 Tax=Cylindrobasidium torrendii FP15055 ss-10 TaxID=1314674 RepID=A0A0D7BQ84_9AGAR|nr:cytochrome P450 [Cylindrobasidium torrendii FP15055 ss-10]